MNTDNNTHEYYVSLETAKLLKEVGFDWEGTSYYQHGVFYPYEIDRERLVIMNQSTAPSYMEQYSAPTLAVAQQWLREVKNIAVYVCPSYEPMRFVAPNVVADDEKWLMKWEVAALPYDIESDEIDLGDIEGGIFDTYEEALEAGIKKALEMILEKGE